MRRSRVSYALEAESGRFVVEDYNWARPLSNFLPGIAGPWGIPMWVYYVNRGQAVCSAGVRDKNGQILEFQSFNLATARVAQEGFRTFIKIDGQPVYEPLQKTGEAAVKQTLIISPAELVLRERHRGLQLELEVVYFTLPGLRVPGLVRDVRLRNLARKARRVQWIDGPARLLPRGLDQRMIKDVARHAEAMMGVADRRGVPLFRLKQTAADVQQVDRVSGGHFYLTPGARLGRDVVVDPAAVFGDAQDYGRPWVFERGGLRAVQQAPQYRDNRTPCALVLRDERLAAGGETRLVSVLGAVQRDEELDALLAASKRRRFFDEKRAENAAVVDEIGQHAFTVSSSPAFDAYARQDFLDNVIRGGMPRIFATAGGKSAFYAYSRQNGDLERDYHFFVLEPTYLSQGTGHYRSVLQNRRTDTWFFPEVGDANLVTFLGLTQLDGYNPLEVNGLSYRVEDPAWLDTWLAGRVTDAAARAALRERMLRAFTPGELLMTLEDAGGGGPIDREALLVDVLARSRENEVGGLHEGFWVDHWHYNIDLLEVCCMVFPDRLRRMLLDNRVYTFFDDPDVVLPRRERAVDRGAGEIRAYGAVRRDPEKERMIAARERDAYRMRSGFGTAEVYRTNLLVKLLCLITNRLATLDATGTGIEMEAGKPGWNDSMNGLPGLFGSGLSETVELRRAIRLLQRCFDELGVADDHTLAVFVELADFARELAELIEERLASATPDAITVDVATVDVATVDAATVYVPTVDWAAVYWRRSNELKEAYRESTRLGICGDEDALSFGELRRLLRAGAALLDLVFEGPLRDRVLSAEGVPYTYFVNEVREHRPTGETNAAGQPLVDPLTFAQRPVKLFLEGPVHWIKDRPAEARAVYQAVRRSKIFDRKLKMYKSCEPLTGETHELGRAVGAYPRGWIENESIYLHMEYKYLLEVLRSGLAAEFWRDAKTTLMPFLDPAVYGRSTTEGASFIASSAYADARCHGQAFQPRLSGITCEFLHIWILAVAGPRPLRIGPGGLELHLEPRLPAWLFTEAPARRPYHDPVDGWTEVEVPARAFAFKLFGRTLVVLHNPRRRPTFGERAVVARCYELTFRDGDEVTVEGPCVPSPLAEAVRAGEVRRIDVQLG